MSQLKTALLAAVVVVGAGSLAYAQMSAAFDPAQLPTVKGKVAQYLPTPRGEVDGLLLDDGTEIHVPPHMSTQLVFAVRPGDAVTIHGLKARAAPMVAAASVTNDASNVTVTDEGPHERNEIQAQGKVKAVLHGMRGEVNGVVLDDGTVVRLPPPEAQRMGDQLAIGKTIVASGDGSAGPLGKSLGARQIGPDSAHLMAVAGPRPGWEHWAHEHFGHHMHGPDMHGQDMHGQDMHGPAMPGDMPPPPAPPPAQ